MAEHYETWRRLLSPSRVQMAEGAPQFAAANDDGVRSPFEVDCERVTFSPQFRRLARKTQVHPFAEIDHVHNRLTHSLEVSSVSHTLAKRVGPHLARRGDVPPARLEDLCRICRAAGLAHDIGNPAYGHSGEQAIQTWAKARRAALGEHPVWNDFRVFDGNAQAFRLLARADMPERAYFRFTLASLGALVKHPRLAGDLAGQADARRPKLAAFSSEQTLFDAVWRELGLKRADGSYMRHPLSYLTEAADDICYRILDFEDAVAMGIFPESEIAALFRRVLCARSREQSAGRPISWLRAVAIHDLTVEFARRFEEHYDEIMRGELAGELKDCLDGDCKVAFGEIRERYNVLFSSHRKVIDELGSFRQFSDVLDVCLEFLECVPWESGGGAAAADLPETARRLVGLAWGEEYYRTNRHRGRAWWAHEALDFVSGMTDDYLNKFSLRLRGAAVAR